MIDQLNQGAGSDQSADPTDPTKPTPSVLTGAQWSAAQSAPTSALTGGGDPTKATTNGLGRVLTGDEWSQAQRMTPTQLSSWKIPAIPAAPRDATRNPNDVQPTGTPLAPFDIRDPITYANPILRQVVDPLLAHPLVSTATLAAPFAVPPALGIIAGLGIAGEGVYHIAQYGWQKAAELSLDPATRKLAEADPERISGEAASVQAIMLGLAPLIHVGVKSLSSAADVSGGLMEAGAEGVKESNFAPRFTEGFSAAQERSKFASTLEAGANAAPTTVAPPKGFEPTIAPPARARSAPVEGLVVPETVKPGRIKPLETQPASAPLQEAADLNAAVRDYQAERAQQDTQDIADERSAAAERLLGLREDDAARVERETAQLVRRRPGGVKPEAAPPLFESPEGANLLGSMAARRGLADDASPYPPTSRLDDAWKAGHDAVTAEPVTAPATSDASATPSFPEGFSMGGALTDNRLPAADELPARARGSNGSNGSNDSNGSNAQSVDTQGETDIPAHAPRAGQTLSDDPRYDSGARRPLHLVTVKGLIKELVDFDDKRADAAQRAVYSFRPDENFHTTEDGRAMMVADRRGGGVSRQAKALQNLDDYARIEREVTQHLIEQRGLPEDIVSDLLDRERAARYDKASAEGEGGDTTFDFGNDEPPEGHDPFAEERRSLERQANTDDLTGLGNKRAYQAALAGAEADPDTKVIRFDANGMKLTNDALGHHAGDALLARIAGVIRNHAPGLPAFRIGGDEFAVFAPADEAEAIRDAVEGGVGYREVSGTHIETGEPAIAQQSISGGIGDTDTEADAATYAQKKLHKAEQGIPNAGGRTEPARGLTPIEGTGETQTRGLARGVAEKALANHLDLTVGELPEYRRLSMADQAARATQLLADDPDLAARVARGDAPAPHGLLPESVFVAVEQRAIAEGDVNTLRDLATSRLTSEATTMGQRIRALAEREPDSPVAAIKDVINTRSGGAANADNVAKAAAEEVGAITKQLEGVHVHGNAWNHLIEALKC